jgi:hypothetical protein
VSSRLRPPSSLSAAKILLSSLCSVSFRCSVSILFLFFLSSFYFSFFTAYVEPSSDGGRIFPDSICVSGFTYIIVNSLLYLPQAEAC